MNPNEFTWDSTGEGRTIDLRIMETREGGYHVQNLKNPDQTYECDSTKELSEFLSKIQPR